jgi:hypothetical protein
MSDLIRLRRQVIRKELREIAADPDAKGAARRAQQLRAEYKRLNQSTPARQEPDALLPPPPRSGMTSVVYSPERDAVRRVKRSTEHTSGLARDLFGPWGRR